MNLIMEKCRGGLKKDPWDTALRSEEFQQRRMSAVQEVQALLIIMNLLGFSVHVKSGGESSSFGGKAAVS